MNIKFLSIILLVCFISREAVAVLPEKYDRPIKQISADEMNRLIKNPDVRYKQVLLTQDETKRPEETAKKRIKEGEEDKDVDEYHKDDRPDFSSSANAWVNFSGSDELLVVFAIVGVVMVIAWVAAFPYTVYKSVANKEDYKNIQLLNANYSRFENFELIGTRYSLYLADPKEGLLGGSMGFSGELGYYNIDEFGQYWMIGPSFLSGFELGGQYSFVKLDLMAGSTFDSNFGLFSKGEVSMNVEVASKLSLGFGMGAIYLEKNSYRGAAFSDNYKWGFLYGANATYLF
jgi:hypothetical protein